MALKFIKKGEKPEPPPDKKPEYVKILKFGPKKAT